MYHFAEFSGHAWDRNFCNHFLSIGEESELKWSNTQAYSAGLWQKRDLNHMVLFHSMIFLLQGGGPLSWSGLGGGRRRQNSQPLILNKQVSRCLKADWSAHPFWNTGNLTSSLISKVIVSPFLQSSTDWLLYNLDIPHPPIALTNNCLMGLQ